VLARIVELLVPATPGLEPADRRPVRAEATRFVVAQIESIPTFLRVPYLAAIVAFDVVAVARYGRTFLRLDEPRQHAYLALWTNSPIAQMRDFVKPIRSCALLAHFDHATVRAALESARDERLAQEPRRASAP
jgi:hypothetical protein